MTSITSGHCEVEHCALHYLQAGSGLPIILLHGMKFQAATWQETGTLRMLAGMGMRALALDMPGFGKSPECEIEQDRALDGFIAEKTTEKPVLLGPSMGGRIALEYAINHPHALKGLILVGAVGVEENRERLAEIQVPTLLIWGGEDAIAPLANSDVLLAEVVGCKRVIIECAPHPCYLEYSEAFHLAVREFIEGLD